MDTPGITVRPIQTMHGVEEFSEVFYDDVRIPDDRLLGQVDGGWAIAMDLLPYERSTALWHRAAYMQRRLERLVARGCARRARPQGAGRGHGAALGLQGPLAGHAAAAGRR